MIENMHEGNNAIQLFDLENDLREEQDAAMNHPEIIEKMRTIMKQEHQTPLRNSFGIEVLEK